MMLSQYHAVMARLLCLFAMSATTRNEGVALTLMIRYNANRRYFSLLKPNNGGEPQGPFTRSKLLECLGKPKKEGVAPVLEPGQGSMGYRLPIETTLPGERSVGFKASSSHFSVEELEAFEELGGIPRWMLWECDRTSVCCAMTLSESENDWFLFTVCERHKDQLTP